MEKKDYRVELKVKNNNILEKIEQFGYKSVYSFSKKTGLCYSRISNLINLKEFPTKEDGSFTNIVIKVANKLKCLPDELFSSAQLDTELKTNKRTMKVAEAEAKFMLSNEVEQKTLEQLIFEEESSKKIEQTLESLTEKESLVIKMRFGLDPYIKEHTLEEISKELNKWSLENYGYESQTNKERVRQIEGKALRKMRHPSRSEDLRDILEGI